MKLLPINQHPSQSQEAFPQGILIPNLNNLIGAHLTETEITNPSHPMKRQRKEQEDLTIKNHQTRNCSY